MKHQLINQTSDSSEHYMISAIIATEQSIWKIFVKHLWGVFQISHNCLSQRFNSYICLFRCLCVNPYLSILFQSEVWGMV